MPFSKGHNTVVTLSPEALKHFGRWLWTKRNEYVGVAGHSTYCPVAIWADVDEVGYGTLGDAPLWVREFVDRLDGRYAPDDALRCVTGEEAILCLPEEA